jgi:rhodanese-related sulfurtransferase
MTVAIIGSKEALVLHGEGATYLDVRSIPEFEAGHAPGAYNIPLLHMAPGGMQPNPKFADEVAAALTDRDRTVIVACKAGGRSAKAAVILEQLGFTRVLDYTGGWSGNPTDAGWERSGGAITQAHTPGRSHGELAK